MGCFWRLYPQHSYRLRTASSAVRVCQYDSTLHPRPPPRSPSYQRGRSLEQKKTFPTTFVNGSPLWTWACSAYRYAFRVHVNSNFFPMLACRRAIPTTLLPTARQATLGYILMLVAMTYSTPLFLCAVLGLILGTRMLSSCIYYCECFSLLPLPGHDFPRCCRLPPPPGSNDLCLPPNPLPLPPRQ